MPLTADELEPLLRLALVQGIGPGRIARIVECFGTAERALAASEAELRRAPGIGGELAQRIHAARQPVATNGAGRALARLRSLGAVAFAPDDPHFPDPFRSVADPPYLLFAIGDLSLLSAAAIAIVGTRTPTGYGRAAARDLSRDLALAGYSIVSGMARGIDTAAHEGALDGGGRTVGVLGHGIDQVYPPENRTLFDRVRERGLLISEFPPGETPKAGNFPRRNRLITALAEAVLVVEMGHRSGAQHTVAFALDQGKEVMAVPGPIGSAASEGTNQLIKDGARMVTAAADVIEELRGVGTAVTDGRGDDEANRAGSTGEPVLMLLSEVENRVLATLADTPVHVDHLARTAGLSPASALVVLLELEMRGLVRAWPGKLYVRTSRSS